MFKMFESGENLQETLERNCRQEILASFERAGFREQLQEELIQRLILLEKRSEFNKDSRKIERGMKNIMGLLEGRHKIEPVTQEQRVDGRIAALLHDIGKSGPVDASPEEQEAVVKVFALKEVGAEDAEKSVAETVKAKMNRKEAEDVLKHFKNCGIDLQITMRQFWNQHAYWTREILERYPQSLSSHSRIIAGSHHIDHGIDPYNLQEKVPTQAKIIGILENYVDALEERILMAVDQYEAQVRRSGASHETAIQWVRKNLSGKFSEGDLMEDVLAVMDELGKQGKIFK